MRSPPQPQVKFCKMDDAKNQTGAFVVTIETMLKNFRLLR